MSQEQRPINIEPISSDVDLEGMTKALVIYCDSFGISISIEAARRCIEHFLYVIQVNQVINLTRITDIDEGIVLHILDSLMFLLSLNLHASEHVMDMGTGAGYPGLPLAATSNADIVLLDSVGKKVRAVSAFIDALGLENAHAVHARVEDYARENPSSFDCVVARAVAPLSVLLEYAAPLLKKDGRLVVSKAPLSDEERSSGLQTAKITGFVLSDLKDFELPCNLGSRQMLTFVKAGTSKVKLPRATGLARRKPLA